LQGLLMASRVRSFVLAVAAALVWASATPARPDDIPAEMAVKATYLYKFVPFVTWPDSAYTSPNAAFAICIVGADAVADSLSRVLAGQRNGTHGIVVRKLATADAGCHVLYAPGSDEKQVRAALDTVRGKPVLTITDMPAGSPAHGMIAFVVVEDHVRFSINAGEATHNGLSVSSKLLNLAVSVEM
jgi:hypothetical protein